MLDLPSISPTDIAIFIFGILVGIAFGYVVGKLIFSQFFRRQAKAITVENVGKFTAIQQGLNYLLGFALGSTTLSPTMGLILLLLWLGVQTFLAMKIFGFRNPMHGLTYAFIDTGSDLLVGTLSGAGAATFTLFRLALMAL
jgi:hypothetical protein